MNERNDAHMKKEVYEKKATFGLKKCIKENKTEEIPKERNLLSRVRNKRPKIYPRTIISSVKATRIKTPKLPAKSTTLNCTPVTFTSPDNNESPKPTPYKTTAANNPYRISLPRPLMLSPKSDNGR